MDFHWYFLDIIEVPDGLHSDIICDIGEIDRPLHLRGYIFGVPDMYHQHFCETLGLALDFESNLTNIAGLLLIITTSVKKSINSKFSLTISTYGHTMDQRSSILTALTQLPTDIGCNVYVMCRDHDNSMIPNTDPDSFAILIWSVPNRLLEKEYKRVFGVELGSGQKNGFVLTDDNSAINIDNSAINIIDDEGIIVAQIVGTSLFIPFDLGHSDGRYAADAGKILTKILEHSVEYFDTVKKRRKLSKDYLETIVLKDNILSEILFYNIVKSGLGKKIDDEKSYINDIVITHNDLLAELSRLIERRKMHEIYLKYLVSQNVDEKLKKLADQQFAELTNIKYVKKISININRILIETKTLFSQPITSDEGVRSRRNFGQLTIVMGFDSSTCSIIGSSLDLYEGVYHPHAHDDGRICLGNVSNEYALRIQNREYGVALQFVLTVLTEINIGDSFGSRYVHWPMVSEEEYFQIIEAEKVKEPAKDCKCTKIKTWLKRNLF
jgi:hypothetical protein